MVDIKKRLNRILVEIRQIEALTIKAENEVRGNNVKKAKEVIEALNVLSVNELQEIKDLLKNMKYDDPELIHMVGNLTKILEESMKEIQFLLRQETNNQSISEDKKAQWIGILEHVKSLGKKEEDIDKAFFGMKATRFEEVLDKSAIPKLPSDTKQKIITTREIQRENIALSDLEKAEKFRKVVDSLGGPERAMKIYKKGFSLINSADRLVRKLGKANPKNALIKESGSYELEDRRSTVVKGINVPYPNVGFPCGKDFAFILTYGMVFSMFCASLMGGIWVAALGGIIALIVVIGVGTWLISKKYTRYVVLGKRAMNLIAYMSQGGNLGDIYNIGNMVPEGGPAKVRRKAA